MPDFNQAVLYRGNGINMTNLDKALISEHEL